MTHNEFEDRGAMRKLSEQGGRQLFVAEDWIPVSKAQIGRDDHRHTLVEGGAELEHELSAEAG
jgi:hypothetical protein